MTCRRTALFVLLAAPASAFYLPGVAPHDYQHGEKVDMKVNKLSSTKTQARHRPPHALPLARTLLPARSVRHHE